MAKLADLREQCSEAVTSGRAKDATKSCSLEWMEVTYALLSTVGVAAALQCTEMEKSLGLI